MTKPPRESKYLNQSGSKTGNWYLNKLDHFEFYSFAGEARFNFACVLCLIFSIWLLPKVPFYIVFLLLWVVYVACLTLLILYRKHCKYHGYFLYPERLVTFFRRFEKETDLLNFDNMATLQKSGISEQVVRQKYKNDGLF